MGLFFDCNRIYFIVLLGCEHHIHPADNLTKKSILVIQKLRIFLNDKKLRVVWNSNIAATGKVDLKTLNELRKQTSVWFEDSKPPVKNKDGASDREISYDIKTVQLLLKSTGFYKGKIDGKMGPETVKAIKRFQRSKNLKASGIINVKTWEKLKKF